MLTESCTLGSLTNNISGIEKIAHQAATDKNDNLMAVAPSGMPKECGCKYINTLIRKSSPPPIYPKEYPKDDV